jgi:regulator of sigma E protease
MSKFLRFLWALTVLTACIAIHEVAHYAAMQRYGVEVEELSIGVGPTLWERRMESGTMLRFRLILLGGYNAPSQKGAESSDTLGLFPTAVISFAGIVANMATAMLVLLCSSRTPLYEASRACIRWGVVGRVPAAVIDVVAFTLLGGPLMLWSLFAELSTRGRSKVRERLQRISRAPRDVNGMEFVALVSLMLACFNLLPLPPLDGGHLVRHLFFASWSDGAIELFRTASNTIVFILAFCAPFNPFHYYLELRANAIAS